ncbi:MAG: nickel pincer cofactor biosynthesis protein LarC [Holophagaceae bacterium]|nr:nickel pincer cofactor biosynthesis protein LarC [Holophagaceae bacterium]
MKTIYFECNMGASGDMLMAALLELHDNPTDFLSRLNTLGIPGTKVVSEPSVKCGITGTGIRVTVNGEEENPDTFKNKRLHHNHGHSHDHKHDHTKHSHSHEHHHEHKHEHGHENHIHSHDNKHSTEGHKHDHSSYHHIEHLLGHLKISDKIKTNAIGVYKLIATAESHAHGVPVTQVHFHEVGELDAVADIVGVCMLLEELGADIIMSSPINVGSGHVHCAHGTLPVPAPATAYILRDVPIYSNNISGELCTPTGAALLKYFVNVFCKMPELTISKLGYGMGKNDFENANCLRAYIGESSGSKFNQEEVIELVCNLDDMTPESLAFAQQLLLDNGALDVYTTPIGMKKGRTGFSFTCMCRCADRDKMLSLMFLHTSTLGIREYLCRRHCLKNEYSTLETKYGEVRIKYSSGFGINKYKPEYEDVASIARREKKSVQDVIKVIDTSISNNAK